MVTHEAEAQYADIKTQHADCNIVHPSDKVFPILEDVILLQSVTADMIISFHGFSVEIMSFPPKHYHIIKKHPADLSISYD